MNISYILFVTIAYTVVYGMIVGETNNEFEFPTFEMPEFDFQELDDCSGFTDCIEFLGKVIYNLGLGIIFLILAFVLLVAYCLQLFAITIENNFEGVDGAPVWLNILLSTPFLFAMGVIVYTAIRRGSTNTAA